jgi:hypothetical protein
MGQGVLRVEGLPNSALGAAEAFYEAWLPQARAALNPLRSGEDLVIVFPSAPYDHRDWRLAAVQNLAREAAPQRVNGIAGDDNDAIAATLHWLASAPGITGQLLATDGRSAEKD